MEIQRPETLERLKDTGWPKKSMQGTPFYEILANQAYADEFGYIGPHWDEREKLIMDGDDSI